MKFNTTEEVREMQWQAKNWQRKVSGDRRISIACEATDSAGMSWRFWLVLQNRNTVSRDLETKAPTYTTRGQKYLYRDGWREPLTTRGRVNFTSLNAAIEAAVEIEFTETMKTNFRSLIRQLRTEPATPHCADFLKALCETVDEMADALKKARADDEDARRYYENSHSNETKEAIEKVLAKFNQL